MSQRWSEVESSIQQNKHFKMTIEELQHAVKYAWRNTTRCIGKIWWETLALRDCRHVKSVDELFEMICQHLKESTNNGKIKPTISVFPQRIPGESDQFRIWNSNVLMYAGYLDPNDTGSVIGNKSNIEFTQVSHLVSFSFQSCQLSNFSKKIDKQLIRLFDGSFQYEFIWTFLFTVLSISRMERKKRKV